MPLSPSRAVGLQARTGDGKSKHGVALTGSMTSLDAGNELLEEAQGAGLPQPPALIQEFEQLPRLRCPQPNRGAQAQALDPAQALVQLWA